MTGQGAIPTGGPIGIGGPSGHVFSGGEVDMEKVDILVLVVLGVLVWYRPLVRRSRKNHRVSSDLSVDSDNTTDMIYSNRPISDDPHFFLRRI